jgi:hypothetical protein
MTYNLSTFDCLFKSYKHLKIEILAILTAFCDKTVRDVYRNGTKGGTKYGTIWYQYNYF